MEEIIPQRMYHMEPLPTLAEIRSFIEDPDAVHAFDKLLDFIKEHYDCEREICFGGKKFGVLILFRCKRKTLLSIFPEKHAFAVLLVYGKNEVEAFEKQKAHFSDFMKNIFDNTPQYHDGKWLLITLENVKYIEELKKMIIIKEKPRETSFTTSY